MGQAHQTPEELLQLAAALKKAVRIKDRRYLFRSYPRCFVGQEAVAWLVSSGAAPSAAEAVQLGNRLMEMGIFHHVCYEHVFEDDYLFYRFTDDDIIILDPLDGGGGGADASTRPSAEKNAAAPAGGQATPPQSCDGRCRRSETAGSDLAACSSGPSSGASPAEAAAGAAAGKQKAPQGPRGQAQLQGRSSQPLQHASSSGAGAAPASAADGAAANALAGGKARVGLLETRQEKQERMRWQVLAGHLQSLQGRVTHMHQAAEAQRAIADILVSECNLLHGQVLELRGRLDTAAVALQAAAAAADANAQQLASLRRLMVPGLFVACVAQQTVLALFRWSGGGGGGSGSGSGAVKGSWWGVVVTVAVAVMGLAVVLPQLLAPLSAPPLWLVRRGVPKALAGGVGEDEASAVECTTAAARDDDGSGSVPEGECAAAIGGSDAVLRRASVSSDSKLVHRSGSAVGQGPTGGALAAPLRRSVTDDLYGARRTAASGALSRRATEVVRLLTAPVRLHFGLAEKQSFARRISLQQTSPPSAAAAAAAATTAAAAGAAAADGTAYTTPLPAAAAAMSGRSVVSGGAAACDDPIGSRYVSALCLDNTSETLGASIAVGGGGQCASPPPPTASPPPAAGAAATVIPRMSDFEGWPDAPVLLTFDTGLVPEHAAAATAAPLSRGSVQGGSGGGVDESSLVSSAGQQPGKKQASEQAMQGELLVRVSAGSAAAAASNPRPPPSISPTSGLVRLCANGVTPIRIETELFSGELVVLLRGLASTPDHLFSGKKRMSWVAMQGRFKQPLTLDSVVTGQEFGRPFKRLPAQWFVEKVLLSMAKQVSPSMRVGPLSSPALLMPLIASAQLVNVSKPGQQAPLMECKEDVRLFCPALTVKAPSAGSASRETTTLPASADTRRRHFTSPRNRAGLRYDTEHVWTFHFWQQFVDLVSYRLDFGYTYDLAQHLDGQPLQIMAKDADSGKYLYSVLVWNERLLAGAHAAAAAAAGGRGGGAAATVASSDAPALVSRSSTLQQLQEEAGLDVSLVGGAGDDAASLYDGRSSWLTSGGVGPTSVVA